MATPQTHPSQEVRLVTLERDVTGMKGDIGEIKSSMFAGFKDLSSKLEAKGATNWNALGLGAMVLLAVLGWGWALFGNFQSRTNDDITGLKGMIASGIAEQKAAIVAMAADTKATIGAVQTDTKASIAAVQADTKTSLTALSASQKAGDDALGAKIDTTTDKFMGRPDILDKLQTAKEKRDAQQANTDARLDRIEADVKEAKSSIVSLPTHQLAWEHQRYVNDLFSKHLDDLTKKNDELFNGRDAIQRLLMRVDGLESRLREDRK